MFFSQKGGGDKNKAKKKKPNGETSSSLTTTASSINNGNKKKIAPANNSKVANNEKEQKPVKRKKKLVILDDDDSDSDTLNDDKTSSNNNKSSPVVVPSPAKKQKVVSSKDDRVAISTDAFFSKQKSSSPSDNGNKPSRSSPGKKKQTAAEENGNHVTAAKSDTDTTSENKKNQEVDVTTTTSTKKCADAISGSSNNSARAKEEKDNDSSSSASPAKRPASTTSAKSIDKDASPSAAAAAAAASPAKKRRTSPSAKKKSTPAKRDPPLVPTLTQDSFDSKNAAPECMAGMTFVFTGIIPGLSRDDAQDFVKCLGGRVTSAVSGKTDYLVVGEILEDGRPYHEGSKYKRAVEHAGKVHLVMGEKALYGLAQQYHDKAVASSSKKSSEPTTAAKAPPAAAAAAAAAAAKSPPPPAASKPAIVKNPYARAGAIKANPYAKKPAASAAVNPYAKKPVQSSALMDDRKPAAVGGAESNTTDGLWVDKYKPASSQEILGNQESVRKLQRWLAMWEHTFNKQKAIGKSFSSPNGPWKAALLSGPPGIGKTTTATLVAKEAGRDVLEFNASDVRSKKALQESIGDVTGSQTLQFTATTTGKNGNNTALRTKRCIIMDEVDGMGAGDRSGMAELIQMIKNSRVPIICICNDRQSQKIKSLLPYCMDLRYRRPVKSVIASRAMAIAENEGLSVERNAAEAIAESCGNDVRQVLNCLQMWASNHANGSRMTYKNLKEREQSINKDEILRVSLFDAARVILEGRKGLSGADAAAERTHFFKRNDAFFVDYNFVGLLVQQNYLKVTQGQFNEAKRKMDRSGVVSALESMHAAADCMSDFAHAENLLRGEQNWSLLPYLGMLTVKTGFHAGGPNGGLLPGYPEFTSWLGKNSSFGKKNRILNELQYHMNYKVSGGTQDLRLSYLPVLREQLMLLLSKDDGVQEAIGLMDEYGLSREDVFERFDEFKMDKKAHAFGDMDSKRKAAFTRTYNQMAHKSQALVVEQGGAKKAKRGGGGAAIAGEAADLDAIDDDAQNQAEEDDDVEDDSKILAAFKRKGRAKAAGGAKKGKAKSKKSKK